MIAPHRKEVIHLGDLYVIGTFGLFPDLQQAQAFCNQHNRFVSILCPNAELLIGEGRMQNVVRIKAPSKAQLERIHHSLLSKC